MGTGLRSRNNERSGVRSFDNGVEETAVAGAGWSDRQAMMEREPVTSSVLASVGYEEASAILEIEFVDGRIYQYFGVPSEVQAGLMAAESLGSYFGTHVKKAGYQYARVG